jgi:hypothetical protein
MALCDINVFSYTGIKVGGANGLFFFSFEDKVIQLVVRYLTSGCVPLSKQSQKKIGKSRHLKVYNVN